MRIAVMANPDTFQILKAEGCPAEYRASNGWSINAQYIGNLYMNGTMRVINLCGRDPAPQRDHMYSVYIDALTALHEMVYQPKQTFSDDGSIVTMEHGKFRIEEWAGNQIVFQVLEMDEEFIGKTHNRVQSEDSPALYERTICLWGRKTEYNLTASVSSKFARTQIISALRDWDQNWPGWKNNIPTLEQCCQYGSLEKGGLFVFESGVK